MQNPTRLTVEIEVQSPLVHRLMSLIAGEFSDLHISQVITLLRNVERLLSCAYNGVIVDASARRSVSIDGTLLYEQGPRNVPAELGPALETDPGLVV